MRFEVLAKTSIRAEILLRCAQKYQSQTQAAACCLLNFNTVTVDTGHRGGITTNQAEKAKAFESKVRRLKQANEAQCKAFQFLPKRSSTADQTIIRLLDSLSDVQGASRFVLFCRLPRNIFQQLGAAGKLVAVIGSR